MYDEQRIKPFQKKVLAWYAKNKRDLPWRKTTNPYWILVSEIMLQQTQVDRVIGYYERWLASFPDIGSLAAAKKMRVLQHWSGLGYNSRALRLQQLAQQVVSVHRGNIPSTEQGLLALPGIGPYTARAVLAFAFNKEAPVVDTNVRRVLIHELKLPLHVTLKELEYIAAKCIPKGKSCVWHNALMDYGAIEKTARTTGIKPLSKQPAFEGSDRQLRGYILKSLLSEKPLMVAEIKEVYGAEKTARVLEKMNKEKIVVSDGEIVEVVRE